MGHWSQACFPCVPSTEAKLWASSLNYDGKWSLVSTCGIFANRPPFEHVMCVRTPYGDCSGRVGLLCESSVVRLRFCTFELPQWPGRGNKRLD